MRLHQLILATHRMTLIDLYAASTLNSCARLLSSERVSVCVCVCVCVDVQGVSAATAAAAAAAAADADSELCCT